jgi:iron complex outermembrane receptor protein
MLSSAAWLAADSAANAQEMSNPTIEAGVSANKGELMDIVVTAQKRSENLQRVPIAATALSGIEIEKRQALTIQGLNGTVPNVQISNFANTPNTAAISIRGIGVIDADPYAGNTVSVIYDGVPQYFSMGALVDLYNIDRVEVLRGPQGTLFGANTTGGAINIVTAQPTGILGFKGQATYGNWNRFDIKGALDVPIVPDVLAGKFVVSHSERDGFVRNIVDGDRMGGRNIELYRGSLKFTPSANISATLTAEYVNARNGTPQVVNGAYPGDLLYVAPGTLGMYTGPCQPNAPCHAPKHYLSANNSEPDMSNMDTHRETLTIEASDTALGSLTSITGYKYFRILEYTDQDASPLDLISTRRYTRGWQFSQELRSAFDITNSINGVVGAFYLKDHYVSHIGTKLTFAGPGLISLNEQNQDNESISGFAQFYAQATERLKLQAGARFTHERTSMLASSITSINASGVTDYFGTGNTPLVFVVPPRGSKSWDKIGWKLGADYEVAERTMAYASWARGFKSGGFAGRIGINQDLGPFNPETVDTYEIGLKTELFDRHLRINAAAFMTNYRNMQIAKIYFVTIDGNPVQGNTIINAASARIKGLELEATAVPVPNLNIRGFVAYLDSKYRDFPYIDQTTVTAQNPLGIVQNLAGNRLQNSPKWQASVSVNYELHIGDHTLTPSVSYSYTDSKFFTSVVNSFRSQIQPTHLVDANIEWSLPGDHFAVSLWATNLLDKRYVAAVADTPGLNGFLSYASPREFGATVKAKF